MQTQKPDCITCTEAKQTVEPFRKVSSRKTQPGKLTHMDLWGKYRVVSINGNQYYIVFVDNAGQYTTANFMKSKTKATQKVKDYLMYLKTQGKPPKALQTN